MLTIKQTAFVGEIQKGIDRTQAAINAGYSPKTARVIAQQNLQKLSIQNALAHHRALTLKKFNISIEKYQEGLYDKAYMDPLELFDETPDGDLRFKPLSEMSLKARQMIRGVKSQTIVATNGATITTTSYLLKDALKAEELFGRSIGAFQKDSLGGKIDNLQVNFYGPGNPRTSES